MEIHQSHWSAMWSQLEAVFIWKLSGLDLQLLNLLYRCLLDQRHVYDEISFPREVFLNCDQITP